MPGAVTGDLRLAVLDETRPPASANVPIGLPALAAAASAEWYQQAAAVPESAAAVLLVLGDAGLPRCLDTVRELHGSGKTVLVTFARSGGMPIADLIAKPEGLRAFFEVCREADAAVATTPESEEIFDGAGARCTSLIPVPCPVSDERWDASIPSERRRGILVGTSNFEAHYYNHTAALLALRDISEETAEPVTVLCADQRFDRRMIRQVHRRWPSGRLTVVDGPVPSQRFARLAAHHKLVFQLEWAGGMGEAAAAALLGRIPCVGGHGYTERIVFPDLCGFGRTSPELRDLAVDLVGDASAAEAMVTKAIALAGEALSPELARTRLAALLDRVAAPAGTATT